MKKQNKSSILRKTIKASVHKRKKKELAKKELMRLLEKTNVGTDSLRISFSKDEGRAARRSPAPHKDEHIVEGEFSLSSGGYGFVRLDEEFSHLTDRDIFIPEGKSGGAISGDRVEAVFHFYRTGHGEEKTEGRVVRITEYSRKSLIGCIYENRPVGRRGRGVRECYFLADDPKFQIKIPITRLDGAEVGDKVEVSLKRGARLSCEVTLNFGSAKTKAASYAAILQESGIVTEFSESELYEAKIAAARPINYEGRAFRGDIIFTIDGDGAKDLDDAVSLKKTRTGWLLGVHIADVSAYVKEKSTLERTAMSRGTSVYFADKVVPMLPPALSNGACSLNAGEEKLALSAMISLNARGEIVGVKIEKSVITSCLRATYREVNEIFLGTADRETLAKYKRIIPSLMRMRELYLILLSNSRARGAMELESTEAEVLLDEAGEPCEIIARERGDAERLIEQFMLTANEAVATYLTENKIPCVYRVHERPTEEKLSSFVTYMHNLGFDTKNISREKSTPLDFSNLLAEAEERGLSRPVSYTMLRTMSKAKYSDVRADHFGLSLSHYCHFTSPIRRLSDLATHRIIHKVLFEGKSAEQYKKYAYRAAAAATESELSAISAERKIENLYKTVYMSSRIGEIFEAHVSSVTSFGFFCELQNTCEGLVPIEELLGSFVYDEGNMSIRSRDVTYKIGDRVTVRLEEADISRGKLRFSVVDTEN